MNFGFLCLMIDLSNLAHKVNDLTSLNYVEGLLCLNAKPQMHSILVIFIIYFLILNRKFHKIHVSFCFIYFISTSI